VDILCGLLYAYAHSFWDAARAKTYYAYPPSPTSPSLELDPSGVSRPIPLSQRLRSLQNELSALENELADPSNPLLQREREEQNLDPGELIRGLVDVRTRLDKIKKGKEGRARLVGAIVGQDSNTVETDDKNGTKDHSTAAAVKVQPKSEIQTMVEIDQRVGELEHIVGSSSTILDEVCHVHRHHYLCYILTLSFIDFSYAFSFTSPHHAPQQSAYYSYTTPTR